VIILIVLLLVSFQAY
ncbi:type I toxin-antitoxin system Ibs family toxin, partial [Escherichia coli]